MIFRTELQLSPSADQINYGDHIMTLGSCFAQHMQGRLQKYKFLCYPNPFGVIFNPNSIVKLIKYALGDHSFDEHELFYSHGMYVHSDFHSCMADADPQQVLCNIHSGLKTFKSQLARLDFLFITLGSTSGFKLKSNDQLVANCHKLPSNLFIPYEVDLKEAIEKFDGVLKELKSFNPDLKVVFTVSPVRHIRHGIIENARSKARLILLVESLIQKHNHLVYFPAFEWMIDDLRDYRFYEKDLIHPNEQAVDYIWNKFVHYFFSSETRALLQQVEHIIKACEHRPFNPSTFEHRQFCLQTLDTIKSLSEKQPNISFLEEVERLTQTIQSS